MGTSVEPTDIKEESVNLELFFKFLNKKAISKEAGDKMLLSLVRMFTIPRPVE